jgi:hypothetical protein
MAAPLGYKDFTTGEVLTANDVDGYLMQGIWVFASAAARDAAVTSPQEGNFAFLKDTNVTTYYTGSAWANLDTTGMVNPMTTTGDTIYSSSGSTPARLGIGTTGQVLTVAGGIPSWANAAGGGKVLQVVFGSYATQVNNSSQNYADTGLTATITPTLNTSKVLVLGVINGVIRVGGGSGGSVGTKWYRGATEIAFSSYYATYTATSTTLDIGGVSINYLDSPATTSATTYKAQFASIGNAAYVGVQDGSVLSTIVLMEIGA